MGWKEKMMEAAKNQGSLVMLDRLGEYVAIRRLQKLINRKTTNRCKTLLSKKPAPFQEQAFCLITN